MSYEQHPLSAAFPAMNMLDLAELSNDIRAHGLRQPIVIFEGKVLDGWHRYMGCQRSGVEPRFVDFDPVDDPVAFVLSSNLNRRHLTESQKAAAVVACSKWAPASLPKGGGEPSSPPPADAVTNREMAEVAGVSERTIQQAKRAHEAGLSEAVIEGKVSAKRAAEVAKLPEPERQAALEAPPAPRPKPAPKAPPALEPPAGGTDAQVAFIERLQKANRERDARIAELEATVSAKDEEIAQLREDLHSMETFTSAMEEMARITEADDMLAQAAAEVKRLKNHCDDLQSRVNGLMSEKNEYIKAAKSWMNKFLRLEKKVKGDLTTDETFAEAG